MIILEDKLGMLQRRLPVQPSHTQQSEHNVNHVNHQNRITELVKSVLIEAQEFDNGGTGGVAACDSFSSLGADEAHVHEFKAREGLEGVAEVGGVGEPDPAGLKAVSVGEEASNEALGQNDKGAVDEGSFWLATGEGTEEHAKSVRSVRETDDDAEVAEEVCGSVGFITAVGDAEA